MDKTRIVSLLPSATEIVAALGAQHRLVGRSHECDYPPQIESLPVCTATRIDPAATSREIDNAVKHALKDALAIYDVLEERLRDLAPDLIVTQDQCDVCAVALRDVELAVSNLSGHPVDLVSLHPNNLDAVYGDIAAVGKAIGAPEAAQALIAEMKSRASAIAKTAAKLARPSVACIEWTDPLMAAGNWVPELVELAGGCDVFGQAGQHAPWIEWNALQSADPDIIVMMPCGFDLQRCRQETALLAQHPAWTDLNAVKAGQVFVTDGNSYFNRPGPRLIDSLETLAEIFHPALFTYGHEVAAGGNAWSRYRI